MAKGDLHITLRPAVPDDLPELQSLYVGTIRNTCRNEYSPAQIRVWTASVANTERWQNALAHQYFLVAESRGQLLGFASLANGDYLDFMYVHQDHVRQGIADRLYQALEKEARRLGSASITSDVSKTARPFFEKKGFRVVKENKRLIRGIEIINYRMIREL